MVGPVGRPDILESSTRETEADMRLGKRTEAEANQKLQGVEHPDVPLEKDNSDRNKTLIGFLIVFIVVTFIIRAIDSGIDETSL